jgi:hypothetical protein
MRPGMRLALGVVGTLTVMLLCGCGGGGGETSKQSGTYEGTVTGCHTGTIKFYVSPSGDLVGQLHIDGCSEAIQIVGHATKGGIVSWDGDGCNTHYAGTGVVRPAEPGSETYVGHGTYTARDNSTQQTCRGRWTVTRTSRTGTLS